MVNFARANPQESITKQSLKELYARGALGRPMAKPGPRSHHDSQGAPWILLGLPSLDRYAWLPHMLADPEA